MPHGVIATVTGESFVADVVASDGVCIVEFWSDDSIQSRQMVGIIEQIARDNMSATVLRADIEQCPIVVRCYGVRSVPTVLVFRDGEYQSALVGMRTRSEIQDAIDRAMVP